MLERILNKLGYVKNAYKPESILPTKWDRLLDIEPPFIDNVEFRTSMQRITNEKAFDEGIKWLITQSLKKVTEGEAMMSKEIFQLLMAAILATDNVPIQFKAWASQAPPEEEDVYDEYAAT